MCVNLLDTVQCCRHSFEQTVTVAYSADWDPLLQHGGAHLSNSLKLEMQTLFLSVLERLRCGKFSPLAIEYLEFVFRGIHHFFLASARSMKTS
jgi:hypothetical protein